MASPTLPFSPVSIVFRPLRVPDDLGQVLRLNQSAVPAVGEIDRQRLEHLIGQSFISLVIEDEGSLVGFCIVLGPGADYGSVNYRWFETRYGALGEPFVYLDRVVIADSHRRRGLGSRLYEAVIAHATEHSDAIWFCLEVNLEPRNDESLAFHARMGFEEVGQQMTDYGILVSLQSMPIHRT